MSVHHFTKTLDLGSYIPPPVEEPTYSETTYEGDGSSALIVTRSTDVPHADVNFTYGKTVWYIPHHMVGHWLQQLISQRTDAERIARIIQEEIMDIDMLEALRLKDILWTHRNALCAVHDAPFSEYLRWPQRSDLGI